MINHVTTLDNGKMCTWSKNARRFAVKSPKPGIIVVNSFEKGTVELDDMIGCDIEALAKTVVGFFHEDSNASEMMMNAFGYDLPIDTVKLKFNMIPMTITKENADVEKICQDWYNALEARHKS